MQSFARSTVFMSCSPTDAYMPGQFYSDDGARRCFIFKKPFTKLLARNPYFFLSIGLMLFRILNFIFENIMLHHNSFK